MKESLTIDNILIYPPKDLDWRYLKNIEIYISDMPLTPDKPQPSWGQPLIKTKYSGEYPFKLSLQTSTKGQYMAIVFLDSTNRPYISFMELEVYGY